MENTIKKVTKRDCLNAIKEMVEFCETQAYDFTVPAENLRGYVENEFSLLDTKAASARKRAEQKKLEGDELRDKIYNVLDDNYMILDDIRAALDNTVTAQELTPRLSQLVDLGQVVKDKVSVKIDDKTKRLTGYKRA